MPELEVRGGIVIVDQKLILEYLINTLRLE